MIVELKFGSTSRQLNTFKPRAMLGKDQEDADMWASDPSVSRRHAEVWIDGDTVYIRDLGSAMGTWINGQPLAGFPVAIEPGQSVYVGYTALGVTWPGRGNASTNTAPLSPEMYQAMASRGQQPAAPPAQQQYQQPPQQQYQQPPQQQYQQPPQQQQYQQPQHQQQQYQQPPQQQAPGQQPFANSPAAHQAAAVAATAATGVAATVGVGGSSTPTPASLSYRRQGGNDNGTVLIALPGDTFANESSLDGFLEFTATDSETVNSVLIELIEFHKKGPKKGHVWDRCLVRQGPWKTKKGDVLPMPFQLRVPSGTSASSGLCHWMLRAYVDIKWAKDIEATAPINMRNTDIEKIRDALGTLDYRIANLEADPLGQKYRGKFNPPMHLTKELNITDINLEIEYLGTNLKVMMEVEKSKFFHRDKRQEFVFELARLRTATVQDMANHWQTEINKLMG